MNPVSVFSRKRVARVDGTFGIIISAVVAAAVCATPDGKNSPEEAWLTLQQSCASCKHCLQEYSEEKTEVEIRRSCVIWICLSLLRRRVRVCYYRGTWWP